MRKDTGELIAKHIPADAEGATWYVLTGTAAEIDRQAAAIIDALSTGKELPTRE